MPAKPRILHLIDDTTPGGVMRVIDHLTSDPRMTGIAQHMVQIVPRLGSIPACRADIVISHMTINWRSLPRLIAFRARHASLRLFHIEHSYTAAFTALNVPAKGRFFALLRTAYSLFDRVIAVSQAQGTWLAQRNLVRPGSLAVIPSAVDLAPFFDLPAPEGPLQIIGAIGRLHRQKGFDVLIDAFRALPHPGLRLHIHGTGPEEAALKAQAEGDTRITFFGHSDDPASVMASVDLVAMPSRWEAFGLVALEARAAQRYLICADVDGLPESGKGALLVRGHTPDAWACALRSVLDRPALATPGQPPRSDNLADWRAMIAPRVATTEAARAVTQTPAFPGPRGAVQGAWP